VRAGRKRREATVSGKEQTNGFDFEGLLKKSALRQVTITNVPLWGIDVTIRELSAAEQRALGDKSGDDDLTASQMLLEAAVVSPKFTPEQIKRLFAEDVSSEPLEYILYGIRKLNRLTREDAKKLEDSFLAAQR
jgi:hypothetical protein